MDFDNKAFSMKFEWTHPFDKEFTYVYILSEHERLVKLSRKIVRDSPDAGTFYELRLTTEIDNKKTTTQVRMFPNGTWVEREVDDAHEF